MSVPESAEKDPRSRIVLKQTGFALLINKLLQEKKGKDKVIKESAT